MLINFLSDEFINNPYPFYAQLLATEEPYFLPTFDVIKKEGIWLFSRYDDVIQLLKETKAVSKKIRNSKNPEHYSIFDLHLLNQDAPTHTRLRNLINKAFSSEKIKALEPKINQIIDDFIAPMKEKSQIDFVNDFARPVPIAIISELMGVPFSDYESVRDWTMTIGRSFDSAFVTEQSLQQQAIALKEVTHYFIYLIDYYRRHNSDNLISYLIQMSDNNNELSYDEMLSMLILILFAGHETTVNLLSNGLLSLLRYPEQFELLKQHPEYMNSAIDEMLRFESPAQRTTFRVTIEPLQINGHWIEAGQQIAGLIGAAHRDSAYFSNPDTFDITRNPNPHIAFGVGAHVCLGSLLARAEAKIAFAKILTALPDLHLAESAPVWNKTTFFRSLQSLPVCC